MPGTWGILEGEHWWNPSNFCTHPLEDLSPTSKFMQLFLQKSHTKPTWEIWVGQNSMCIHQQSWSGLLILPPLNTVYHWICLYTCQSQISISTEKSEAFLSVLNLHACHSLSTFGSCMHSFFKLHMGDKTYLTS